MAKRLKSDHRHDSLIQCQEETKEISTQDWLLLKACLIQVSKIPSHKIILEEDWRLQMLYKLSPQHVLCHYCHLLVRLSLFSQKLQFGLGLGWSVSLSPAVQIVQIKDTITDLNYTVSNTGHSLKSDQIIAKYSHFQTVNDSLWKVGLVNRNILEAIKKSFEGLRLKEASCYSLLLSLPFLTILGPW